MDGAFERTERALLSLIENLRQCVILVEDFAEPEQQQQVLNLKLNKLVEQFQQVSEAAKQEYSDVEIPLELVDFVYQGRNPDLYLQKQLEAVSARHLGTHAKITALTDFKQQIEKEMQEQGNQPH